MADTPVQVSTGRFTVTGGTGNQSITGVGFQPKAYILIYTKNASDDADSSGTGSILSIGMTDGTTQFCMASGAEDAQSTSDVGRRGFSDAVLATHSAQDTQAVEGEANHVSMDTDGFTINKSVAFTAPASPFVHYIAFGGGMISVSVGTVDLNDTQDALFDVATLSFEPDLVLTSYIGYFLDALGDTNNDDHTFSLGWAVNPARQAANNQYSMMVGSQDGVDPAQSISRFDNVRAGTSYRDNAIDASFEIGSFDSTGFSVTTRLTAAVANEIMGYLAIKLGPNPKVYSVARTARTSTGNDVEAGAGFEPLFLLGMGSAVVTAANTNTNGGSMAIGITDGNDTFAIMEYDEDGNTTSDTATRVTNTQFMSANLHTGAIDWEATFSSFDSGGWTINYGDAAASAYQNAFLAIGQSGCYAEGSSTWSATMADVWVTQSLSGTPWFVPANAVVEVVVRNGDDFNELWGGVRAVGSGLERRFQLQEAEDGGNDRVTMHVQTNASSQIQHYADTTADLTFLLAGYWTCGTYVETFNTFTAGASTSWQDRNLCTYGVRPGHVAEIVMTNDDTVLTREAGVRTNGSVLERRLNLRNAEAGGVDAASMMVKADTSATATIDLYAQDDADVDFYLVGYWSVAPLAYTELFVDVGSPTFDATWTDLDLTASGVPNGAVAEFVLANEDVDEENSLGVRTNGSALGRTNNLVEAEDGGMDMVSTHVLTDGGAGIEFYHQDVSDAHTFWLVGYWTTCDTSISYVVTDLGAVTGANSSLGWHINSSENVAGFEEDTSGNPDAWYLSCSSFTSLGTLGGADAESHGINNAGMVAGWSHIASGHRRAFSWTSGGGLVNLGVISARTDSEAQSVNTSSEIVGMVMIFAGGAPVSNRLAFLYLPLAAYTLGAGMNSLGTLGGTQSQAMDINDSGRVVGGAQNGSGNFRPFRWNTGTMTDLGTLGGDSVLPDHRAEAVNTSGNIAGRSYTAGAAQRAFYWNGSMTDLGVLTGGTESWAFGLNDSNVVVGTSDVSSSVFRAFVWDSTNGLRNLNNLIPTGTGWTLIRATDINNDGFITGFGTNGSAQNRAFLLTPACSAGGGAAFLSAVLAEGSGSTDEQGIFTEPLLDGGGATLGSVEVSALEAGIKIDYTMFESDPISDPTSMIDAGAHEGFETGIAFPRTLRVATTALQSESSVLVLMTFTREEVSELGVDPTSLQIHVLDTNGDGESVWIPAGVSLGESLPSDTVGDTGFIEYDDGAVEYWAVRNSGGTFAVGKPVYSNPDGDSEAPRPGVPALCGVAMIQALFGCSMVLLASRSWGRYAHTNGR